MQNGMLNIELARMEQRRMLAQVPEREVPCGPQSASRLTKTRILIGKWLIGFGERVIPTPPVIIPEPIASNM